MPFDHERLDVYQTSLDFLAFADDLAGRLPRGRSHLSDQLTRAATSIVLNIAEGAGKLGPADKRRYYLTSAGSTTESAAILDACLRLKLLASEEHAIGKGILDRIMSMLVKLARRVGEG
jgi:four helix bundle protein